MHHSFFKNNENVKVTIGFECLYGTRTCMCVTDAYMPVYIYAFMYVCMYACTHVGSGDAFM